MQLLSAAKLQIFDATLSVKLLAHFIPSFPANFPEN